MNGEESGGKRSVEHRLESFDEKGSTLRCVRFQILCKEYGGLKKLATYIFYRYMEMGL